jgi:hypothetical protein
MGSGAPFAMTKEVLRASDWRLSPTREQVYSERSGHIQDETQHPDGLPDFEMKYLELDLRLSTWEPQSSTEYSPPNLARLTPK